MSKSKAKAKDNIPVLDKKTEEHLDMICKIEQLTLFINENHKSVVAPVLEIFFEEFVKFAKAYERSVQDPAFIVNKVLNLVSALYEKDLGGPAVVQMFNSACNLFPKEGKIKDLEGKMVDAKEYVNGVFRTLGGNIIKLHTTKINDVKQAFESVESFEQTRNKVQEMTRRFDVYVKSGTIEIEVARSYVELFTSLIELGLKNGFFAEKYHGTEMAINILASYRNAFQLGLIKQTENPECIKKLGELIVEKEIEELKELQDKPFDKVETDLIIESFSEEFYRFREAYVVPMKNQERLIEALAGFIVYAEKNNFFVTNLNTRRVSCGNLRNCFNRALTEQGMIENPPENVKAALESIDRHIANTEIAQLEHIKSLIVNGADKNRIKKVILEFGEDVIALRESEDARLLDPAKQSLLADSVYALMILMKQSKYMNENLYENTKNLLIVLKSVVESLPKEGKVKLLNGEEIDVEEYIEVAAYRIYQSVLELEQISRAQDFAKYAHLVNYVKSRYPVGTQFEFDQEKSLDHVEMFKGLMEAGDQLECARHIELLNLYLKKLHGGKTDNNLFEVDSKLLDDITISQQSLVNELTITATDPKRPVWVEYKENGAIKVRSPVLIVDRIKKMAQSYIEVIKTTSAEDKSQARRNGAKVDISKQSLEELENFEKFIGNFNSIFYCLESILGSRELEVKLYKMIDSGAVRLENELEKVFAEKWLNKLPKEDRPKLLKHLKFIQENISNESDHQFDLKKEFNSEAALKVLSKVLDINLAESQKITSPSDVMIFFYMVRSMSKLQTYRHHKVKEAVMDQVDKQMEKEIEAKKTPEQKKAEAKERAEAEKKLLEELTGNKKPKKSNPVTEQKPVEVKPAEPKARPVAIEFQNKEPVLKKPSKLKVSEVAVKAKESKPVVEKKSKQPVTVKAAPVVKVERLPKVKKSKVKSEFDESIEKIKLMADFIRSIAKSKELTFELLQDQIKKIDEIRESLTYVVPAEIEKLSDMRALAYFYASFEKVELEMFRLSKSDYILKDPVLFGPSFFGKLNAHIALIEEYKKHKLPESHEKRKLEDFIDDITSELQKSLRNNCRTMNRGNFSAGEKKDFYAKYDEIYEKFDFRFHGPKSEVENPRYAKPTEYGRAV